VTKKFPEIFFKKFRQIKKKFENFLVRKKILEKNTGYSSSGNF